MEVPTRAEQYLDEACLDRADTWAVNLLAVPCSRVVAAARGLGAAPRVAVELAVLAPRPARDTSMGCLHRVTLEDGSQMQSFCGEGTNQVAAALAAVHGWHGLSLSAVLTCLRAGLSAEEAAQYVRDGGDLEPMAALAALAADPSNPVIPSPPGQVSANGTPSAS